MDTPGDWLQGELDAAARELWRSHQGASFIYRERMAQAYREYDRRMKEWQIQQRNDINSALQGAVRSQT